ncbi:hypothetical protein L7F22_044579 [Adiantum nelumboides]|nr:hypothetical protein [Adiantum nelumboides]
MVSHVWRPSREKKRPLRYLEKDNEKENRVNVNQRPKDSHKENMIMDKQVTLMELDREEMEAIAVKAMDIHDVDIIVYLCKEDHHQAESDTDDLVESGSSGKSSSLVQSHDSSEDAHDSQGASSVSINDTPDLLDWKAEELVIMSHVPCQEDQHADASQAAEPEPNKTIENGMSEKCVQPDHSGESGDENPGDNSASITDTPKKQYAEEDREDDGFVANVLSQEDEHASRAELTGDDITKNGTFEKASLGQLTADDCGEENDHANQGDSFISTDTLDQTAPGKHRKDVEVKGGNFVEDDAAISVHTSYRDVANIIIENVTQEASSTNADSSCNNLNNENPVTRTTPAKRQFFYIVRIPRPVEHEKLKNQNPKARGARKVFLHNQNPKARGARAKLDEAVLKRDRFQKELREKRVIRAELFEKAKPISVNERALRVLLQARRAETDSLYQVSKKAKNPKGTAG